MAELRLEKISDYVWELPQQGEMRVPGRIYGDQRIIDHVLKESSAAREWNALLQVHNVATLPGIVKASLAMPDIHPGYGFPIGGVGAFDPKDGGVVAMGGIGFDINCLAPQSKILHEHGYVKEIKDFKEDFLRQRIKCVNPSTVVKDTSIELFMEFRPQSPVFRVLTEAGYEIVATADHPLLTPSGMVPLRELGEGALVSVYPFAGVEYEEPSDEVIVAHEDIRKLPLAKDMSQTIEELEKRGLLPLRMDNNKLPYLMKIMGFLWGDGTVYFTDNKGFIQFYGDEEDLKDIRRDIEKLGFQPSRIYSRERSHKIDTQYGRVEFERTEHSFQVRASSLAALLWAMGTPVGDKGNQDWCIPPWLFNCPRWLKRLFLASLFGAELSKPKTVPQSGYDFYPPILSLNKAEDHLASGRRFLQEMLVILKEFGVEGEVREERDEYKRKDGKTSKRLLLSSRPANLIELWSKVSYEYNRKRRYLANVAVQYLKLKQKVIAERGESIRRAKALQASGVSNTKIYTELSSEHVNRRFIERSLYEQRKTVPRAPQSFPTFDEFLEEATSGLGRTGQVWDRIASKELIEDYDDLVYDFTVADEHHNFIANSFVVSNCGVRTLRTPLKRGHIEPRKEELADRLFRDIPAGLGSTGELKLSMKEIDQVLLKGAEFAIARGYGLPEDLEYTEERGRIANCNPENVSNGAKERQFKQVGTLGSGNHYLEVQYVEEIYDEVAAKAYGLEEDQVLVAIHCGSRALGHQIGQDYLQELERASKRYGIPIRERELVCAPIESPEGERYISAVNCGINCAFANRQTLAHLVRRSLGALFGLKPEEIRMLYDVGHNTAKFETHEVDGSRKRLLVHRKGSTRAFGPGREENPPKYREVGHPIFIGGTMGTYSYIMRGTELGLRETFGSGIHGAGREMSRQKAKRQFRGEQLREELKRQGIIVRGHSLAGLAEEAPGAYKDIEIVAAAAHNSGVNRKVARLRPLVVVKG